MLAWIEHGRGKNFRMYGNFVRIIDWKRSGRKMLTSVLECLNSLVFTQRSGVKIQCSDLLAVVFSASIILHSLIHTLIHLLVEQNRNPTFSNQKSKPEAKQFAL